MSAYSAKVPCGASMDAKGSDGRPEELAAAVISPDGTAAVAAAVGVGGTGRMPTVIGAARGPAWKRSSSALMMVSIKLWKTALALPTFSKWSALAIFGVEVQLLAHSRVRHFLCAKP